MSSTPASTAGTRSQYRRDLRDNPRRESIAQENLCVSAERDDALLNARTARVVETDHRRAVPHREIHDLHDLLGKRLRERASEHREILREDVNQPPVDLSVARDHAIAVEFLRLQPEVRRPMDDEAIQLDKRALVEKKIEPFARGELAFLVLRLEARLASALLGLRPAARQELELLSHRHKSEKLTPSGMGI
jgi:hypothetical protein